MPGLRQGSAERGVGGDARRRRHRIPRAAGFQRRRGQVRGLDLVAHAGTGMAEARRRGPVRLDPGGQPAVRASHRGARVLELLRDPYRETVSGNGQGYESFVAKEPGSQRFFRKYIGGDEYINGFHRWILYLAHSSPSDLRQLPEVRERIRRVREYRASSRRPSTVAMAAYPTRVGVDERLSEPFLVLPNTNTELGTAGIRTNRMADARRNRESKVTDSSWRYAR